MVEAQERGGLGGRERHVLVHAQKRATGAEQRDVILVEVLEGREVVRPIAHDRSAEGEARVPARVVDLVLLERPLGAQGVGPDEAEDRPVHLVAAGLGDHDEPATRGLADLGVEALADDAELTDRVLADPDRRLPVGRLREVEAVDQVDVGPPGAGVAEHRAAATVVERRRVGLDVRRQERQPLEPPVGHRQVRDLLGEDVGRHVPLVQVDHRQLAADCHRSGGHGLQDEAEVHGLPDEQLDRLVGDRLRALAERTELPRARRQGRNRRSTTRVGHRLALGAGPLGSQDDRHAGKRRLVRVDGVEHEHRAVDLRHRDHRHQDRRGHQEPDRPDARQGLPHASTPARSRLVHRCLDMTAS